MALFLSVLMLLQGCTVFRSASVSLEEAVRSETEVKVETYDNRTLKFDRIGNDGSGYYGEQKVKGVNQQIPLEENEVNVIRLKNKVVTNVIQVGSSLAVLFGFFYALANAGWY